MLRFERVFTHADQLAFAKLSGDFNPIHLDPIQSRTSLFGEPIVHGVHALLWCLIEYKLIDQHDCICALKVRFSNPIKLNERVFAELDDQQRCIRVKSGAGTNLLTIFYSGKAVLPDLHGAFAPEFDAEETPSMIPFDKLEVGMHVIKLVRGNSQYLKVAFPQLTKSHPAVAEILFEVAQLSNIVGMSVPGKYSLFFGLNLDITGSSETSSPRAFISRLQHSLRLVHLDYQGLRITANLSALALLPPLEYPSIMELRARGHTIDTMSRARILVIGGSRGLGRQIASIACASGCDVTITYNKGVEEAKRLEMDCRENNVELRTVQLDVTFPLWSDLNLHEYSHIFYCASPKILSTKIYDKRLEASYYAVYVRPLSGLLNELSKVKTPVRIISPSTIFISDRPDEFQEYTNAKLAMENLCAEFHSEHVKVFCPRLSPLDTDQNRGLAVRQKAIDVNVAAKELLTTFI